MYVMERLLDNIAEIDYPKDKLEIQVLDDSTDETVQTTRNQIEKLRQTGLDIQHIRRKDRTGFVITSYSIHYTKLYEFYLCSD